MSFGSLYDTIVVGGGPAGLTAAIHLAWHKRKVQVIDRRSGPLFFTLEQLWNVPGMPQVRGNELQARLREQAEGMGAEITKGNVIDVQGELGSFRLIGEAGEQWRARTLLLATGVARHHPTVDGDFRPCFKYAGKGNLFYCPDCEAPEIAGKHTVVIGVGAADSAAAMALGLSRYTSHLEVLVTSDTVVSEERLAALVAKQIDVRYAKITQMTGPPRRLESLTLDDDSMLEAEAFFVSSPALGRTDLAQKIGVEMAPTNNHAQPRSQRGDTNIAGVWIAGDLRPMTQQVAVATGTGNIAAVMIDQFLRKGDVA